jgi:hypothetical protein
VIRRKPLFYIFNLIIPTSIITIVAIVGFFTPASTGDERTEKFNLGITTLLAMSILLLMVADQMPTTSEFVPLIGDFEIFELRSHIQIRYHISHNLYFLPMVHRSNMKINTGIVLSNTSNYKTSTIFEH